MRPEGRQYIMQRSNIRITYTESLQPSTLYTRFHFSNSCWAAPSNIMTTLYMPPAASDVDFRASSLHTVCTLATHLGIYRRIARQASKSRSDYNYTGPVALRMSI
jgi:hypothetical protein